LKQRGAALNEFMRSLRTRPTWRAVAGLILSVTPAVILKRALQAHAKNRLTELARTVEGGDTIVVMRNGRPVLDLVPHKPHQELLLKALTEFKKRNGIKRIATSMPAYFDESLPEDVLLKPLPPSE
jgi:antitoxin (DNA-binding transcriptional repressor) of toxin-antitoxin stability system